MIDMMTGKIIIIVDDREPNDFINHFSAVRDKNGDPLYIVKRAHLPIGDVVITTEPLYKKGLYLIIIERKTVKDFIKSITDKRLFEQLNAMKKEFTAKTIFYILEGKFGDREFQFTRMSPNSIYGAYITICRETTVIPSLNKRGTCYAIEAIIRRFTTMKSPKMKAGRLHKSGKSLLELQEYLLEGLPDIGTVTARKIMNVYEKPIDFFSAVMSEIPSADLRIAKKEECFVEWKNILDTKYEGDNNAQIKENSEEED